MDHFMTLILLFSGLSSISCSHFPLRKYFYYAQEKTLAEAQLYCRDHHTDLATFESMDEINQLNRPAGITVSWIGLIDYPESWYKTIGTDPNSWRWSTTGQMINSQYHSWSAGSPNYNQAAQECTCLSTEGTWNDMRCTSQYSVLCYKDNGQNQKTYVHNSTSVSWEDAQAYCRQHFTDLAVITNSEENAMAQSVILDSTKAWIGLYRKPWVWSDKTPTTFTYWRANSPNNYNGNQHCVVEDENHQWEDNRCALSLPFICHEVLRAKTTIKMRMKTSANLTIPSSEDQILQKIRGALESRGWTSFKLLLRTQKYQA